MCEGSRRIPDTFPDALCRWRLKRHLIHVSLIDSLIIYCKVSKMTVIIQHDILWLQPVEYRIESFYDYPDLQFMAPEHRTKVESQLLSGELQSFCVRVDLIINGVTLGTDWLSGCIYKDLQEFIDTIGYFQDMVRNVQLYARSNIEMIQSISLPPL